MQLIWWVEELNVGHSLSLSLCCICICICLFCHHHHFVFSTLVAGGNESHVCREPQSVCHPNLYLHSQIWYLRNSLCLFYAGTSNIKCLMFNVQCSMFNVPILDVSHMWGGCSQRQGQRPWNWKWGRMHCLQNGLILSQAKCVVLVLSPAKCMVPNEDLFGLLGPY